AAVDVKAGHLTTLESHELPADHGSITPLAGLVAPATIVALGCANEIERSLSGRLEHRVGGHGVGFPHSNAGQAVGIHAASVVTIAVLLGQQVFQAEIHLFAVNIVLVRFCTPVRLAGTEEGKQTEGGRSDVVVLAETIAVTVTMLIEAVQRP